MIKATEKSTKKQLEKAFKIFAKFMDTPCNFIDIRSDFKCPHTWCGSEKCVNSIYREMIKMAKNRQYLESLSTERGQK